MGRLRNLAMAGLRAGFQLSERTKPIRTIDEINWLVIDVLNRSNPPEPTVGQGLQNDIVAARTARRAVERTGGDEAALAAIDERIAVLESLHSPVSVTDSLAGSISTRSEGRRFAAGPNPALVPIGEHRSPRVSVMNAMRSIPGRLTQAGAGPRPVNLAQGQLHGQRDALRLVKGFLATQGASTQEVTRLDELIDARLAALDATAPALANQQHRRPPAPRSQAWQPSAPATPSPPGTVTGRIRQRINIVTGQDRRA